MKKCFIYLLLFSISLSAYSQILPDNLQHLYDTATTAREKLMIIGLYRYQFLKGTNADKIKPFSQLLAYFTKKKDNVAIAYTLVGLGDISMRADDLSTSLKYGIAALPFFEKAEDTYGLLIAYNLIGNSYTGSKNYEQGLVYWKKSMAIAKDFDSSMYSTILNNTAGCYNFMNLPDSALSYAEESVRIDEQLKDTDALVSSISTLGETYIARGDNEIARPFIRQSMSLALLNDDTTSFVYGYNDLSRSFYNAHAYDSSLFYARKALAFDKNDYSLIAIESYKLMYQTFEKENKQDSSDRYFRLCTLINDSVLSDEKNKNIQALNFQEQIRQQEIEAQQEELALQHKQNIENALIALGIISFTILFLLMSRSFITNTKLIRFLGVIALLLVFEFVNLLVHSYVEELTDHSQILMLLLLVGLATLLVPLHHKIEKWTIEKLVEKNKQLRLAAAKKTLEKLEKKNEEEKQE